MRDTPTPRNPDASDARGPSAARADWRTALLISALLPAGLFSGVLLRGETFLSRDLVLMHRPYRTVLAHLWAASGGLPTWDPLSNMGREFAANPHYAVFHPLSLFFFLLPWELAFRLQVLLPLIGTGFAMFFFLRTIGIGRPAALTCALAWAFGGLALSLTNLLPVLLTAAPIPALAAFAIRVVRGRERAAFAGASACTALTCAGGEPATLLAGATITGAACFIELLHARNRHVGGSALRSAVRLAGALALGLAGAAVVLVPAIRLGAASTRANGLPSAQALDWSFPLARLAELGLPRALGRLAADDAEGYWGADLYPTRKYPLVYSIYPGLLITALAAAALGRPGARRVGWTFVAVAGTVVAAGAQTPIWRILSAAFPALAGLRYPEKWVIVPVFALVVLAADQLDELLDSGRHAFRRTCAFLGSFAIAAAALGAAVAGITALRGAEVWEVFGLSAGAAHRFAAGIPGDCGLQAALAAAYVLAALLTRRNPAHAACLLAAVLALDLFHAGKPLVPTDAPEDADGSAAALALRALKGSSRVFNLAEWQNIGKPRIDAASVGVPARFDVGTAFEPDVDITLPRWSVRSTDLFWRAVRRDPNLMAPLLARRGVAWVLQDRAALAVRRRGSEPTTGTLSMELIAVEDPAPDIACVDRVVRFQGDAAWLTAAALLGQALRTATLVEESDAGALPTEPSGCTATLLSNRPGRLTVEVVAHGPNPSVLAVNQSWHPGWRAEVDGARSEVARTDVDLCAVSFRPGRHRLDLVYTDVWLSGSLAVSAAALLVCALLMASAVKKTRGQSNA
ncbi:MAG: hypothetical protein ABR961_05200 [Thermoanaerobaculaceae bacterium]|jgi:hypothetical protein